MSLVDFDDDASFHSVSAPAASYNGHASIDDPFGFDQFGTGSSGTKTTTVTETVFSGNSDKLFDDFDPLATFGDAFNKNEVTTTTRIVTTTSTSSDDQPKHDQFDPFGDFATNGLGDLNQATSFETSRQPWADDDFEPSNRSDILSHDLDGSGSPRRNEFSDEKTGVVVPESSVIVDNCNPFLTSEATKLVPATKDEDIPASLQFDGVFPHSITDVIDEIFGDFNEETAPRAEMEDLSPVKLAESKTSPNKFESSLDSQFNFDEPSKNWKSATFEVVKTEIEATDGVEFNIVEFNNLKNASMVIEDAKKSESQQNEFPDELETAMTKETSLQVNADNFDFSNAAASDPFLAGNSVPREGSPGDFSAQGDLDFNTADNDSFLDKNSIPREGSPDDFSAQGDFDFNTADNDSFLAGNSVPTEGSLGDFRAKCDLDFNTADKDSFLAGNSIPRDGSPSVRNDFEEQGIFRQFADEVRNDEGSSVLDQNVCKVMTVEESTGSSVQSAFVNAFSSQHEIDFRPKEKEQKPTAVPETVYNKMYNYRQDNSWEHKDMDDEDVGPVQFQVNNQRREEPEEESYSKEEEEDESSRSDQFFNEIKDRDRGRINIEEIRQRSYEDVGPSSSSHSQNRKEQKPANKSPVVYVLGAAADNVCKLCAKRVYEMEKVTADCQVYHKACFRCHHCNRILSLGNFSANEGRLYCKPHFIEIFKTKGNYKDSFTLAEQQKLRGDDFRGDDAFSQDQEDQGFRRSLYEDKSVQRNRETSARYQDDDEQERGYDDDDEDGSRQRNLKEEIPVVPIKSVRSIFEKMSQDGTQPPQQQKKPTTKASTAAHTEATRRPNQEATTERIRNDSERSDLERERHTSVERRDSTSERGIIQSSTTCIVEDELPPPAFTRSLLAKFKMMEDSHGTGNKAPVVYGAPVSKQTKQTTPQRHQTLSYRSSADSRSSNEPAAEEIRVDRDAPDSAAQNASQDCKEDERADELPQAGLAKSLLAQWRNLEEQSKRGRNREPRSSSSARRSQSMSRVETVQRAHLYPVTSSTRSKQEEDIRMDAYSDQEASGDDLPTGIPTKQRLAKFRELEGESRYGSGSSAKPKKVDRDEKTFKWEVKEPLPMNRGVLIVHGDVPRKPTAEEAAAATASAARWSDSANEYAGPEHLDRRSVTDDDEGWETSKQVPDNVVHSTTTTVINEDELPPPATTRTLLQHFKLMEDVTKAPPRPRVAMAQANREPASKMKQAAVFVDDEHEYEHTHQSSLNRDENDYTQRVASPESGEFGNDPVHDPSVVRESDNCDEEDLPAQGTTKSLLAKFQSLQGKR